MYTSLHLRLVQIQCQAGYDLTPVYLQAYAWDWLMSIPEEYAAVRKVGFKAPNIAYFLSRSVICAGDLFFAF